MKNDYSTATPAPVGASPEPPGDGRLAAAPTTRSRIVWFIIALACAALTARLGVWQLSRAHQKTSAAQLITDRSALPPMPAASLARGTATGEDQWQRRITLEGRWDPVHTVFLMNRTMDERAGFFVMTPLRLADGSAVVVQRGWIARDDVDPMRAPAVNSPAGQVRVEARVAPWPSHWIDIGHGAGGPVRQNLERGPLQSEAGMEMRPVTAIEQANTDNAGDGLRRDWPAPDGNAITNYGYAVQWFAMSVAFLGLYVWVQFFRKRSPQADE